jgi:serine/threonine protein kinase
MKNGNLRNLLRKDAPRPSALTLQWILTILEGFDYIHGRQVFQGDVSARNVLVANDLSVVLSDFSGSKVGDKSCLVRPETRYEIQTMQPFEVSRASDIFAIGSLLYEIVTGRPPYDGLEEDEVEKRFKRAEFPSTADVMLGEVIKGCWAGKYDTVRQVLDDVSMQRGQILDGSFARLSRLWKI